MSRVMITDRPTRVYDPAYLWYDPASRQRD